MADVLTRRAIEIWERLEAEVERLKGVLREYEGEAETLRRIEGEQAAEIAALRRPLEAWMAEWFDEHRGCGYGLCSGCGAAVPDVRMPFEAVEHTDTCILVDAHRALAAPPSAHVARFQAAEKVARAYENLRDHIPWDAMDALEWGPMELAADGYRRALREGDGASG